MAGPCAGILLPKPMSDEMKADIRADIRRMSTDVEGDDFRVQDRPFTLILGPDEGELEEYRAGGVPEITGWPRETRCGLRLCVTAFRIIAFLLSSVSILLAR